MASTKDTLRTSIIKSDRAGRARYTQRFRDEVLAAFEASGMSGAAFAEHCGVKYQTFATWAAKRRREKGRGERPAEVQKFVIAEFGAAPESDADPGGLRVDLPGGASARLAAAGQVGLLAALIRALA
jgi:transposase-like protein